MVLSTEPVDLNIVLERMNLPAAERFDLIVATNVFVYYDRLEQALALQNVSTLLKPGGILLSNDELPEIPGSRCAGWRNRGLIHRQAGNFRDLVSQAIRPSAQKQKGRAFARPSIELTDCF